MRRIDALRWPAMNDRQWTGWIALATLLIALALATPAAATKFLVWESGHRGSRPWTGPLPC